MDREYYVLKNNENKYFRYFKAGQLHTFRDFDDPHVEHFFSKKDAENRKNQNKKLQDFKIMKIKEVHYFEEKEA